MLRLKVYDDQEKIQDIELNTEVVSIGREPENTLVLPDASVSRRHAQIERNGNFFLLRDNGSTNGTFVNEMLVRVQVLNHGDTLRIGKYLLRAESTLSKPRESTRVRVEELRLPGAGARPRALPEKGAPGGGMEPPVQGPAPDRLLRLYEVQKELAYLDTTQALLDRALDIILLELNADRASILRCRPSDPSLSSDSSHPEAPSHFLPFGARYSPEAYLNRTQEELVIPEEILIEGTSRPRGVKTQIGDGKKPGIPSRSCLVSPIRERNLLRGVVYVDREASRSPFRDEDVRFLDAISAEIAVSLANAELFSEISAERDKVRAIFTSLSDGALVTDRDFKVVEANAAATLLLQLEGKNPLGVSLFELISTFQLAPEEELLRASSLLEGSIFQLTRRASAERGATDCLLVGRMLPYPARQAEPKGFVITLRDLSETQRLEELKSRFIGNVAHKLRSPLTVIQGNLPLLRGEAEGVARSQEILEEVERNSRALGLLVDQFVEFAEMEVKSLRSLTASRPVELEPILLEAIKLVQPEAKLKGIQVVGRVPADLPPISGQAERLLRAFQQVLENAVKFAGPGKQVLLESKASGSCLRVDFVDDGPGIPEKELESIFYICHQVDEEMTGEVPGAGLGLTIARHIIQEHGGDIQIQSPFGFPDHGTRVSVLLPVRDMEPAPRPTPSATADSVRSDALAEKETAQ
jgi:two-component system phosphate regulon sensor histidine kinase PhoR